MPKAESVVATSRNWRTVAKIMELALRIANRIGERRINPVIETRW